MTSSPLEFLRPGAIGGLDLKNRLVRAATSETMATEEGEATPGLLKLYSDLARGGAGLLITGHIYVAPRGQYEPLQLGLDHDDRIGPLLRVTDAIHREGGRIFAELSHAGSQSVMTGLQPLAPSLIPNAMSARSPAAMSAFDIAGAIEAFGLAAHRARRAGFDGVHLHAGNGYLLSQFNSPYANRRTDEWGGDASGRRRFLLEVYRAVRDATSADYPITARLGLADAIPEGLSLSEGLAIAKALAAEGLNALEVSYGLMSSYLQNIRPYVGVTPARGLADGVVLPLFAPTVREAYYRSFARAAKNVVDVPVILVGGLRSTSVMDEILRSGDADFLALARPFVREPDLVRKFELGRRGPVACVSCNLCLKHEGIDSLRCWRTPLGIVRHVYKRHVKRESVETGRRSLWQGWG